MMDEVKFRIQPEETLLTLRIMLILYLSFPSALMSAWLPRKAHGPLLWGCTEGIVFGLPSEGGLPGPRGLIRVGIMNRKTGQAELINFIAIEPVVGKSTGYSEMEASRLDQQTGKRLHATSEHTDKDKLSVWIEVEPFDNGAKVFVLIQMLSSKPDEIALAAFPQNGSRPISELHFTATMGSYERLRQLWLGDTIIDSRTLYQDTKENQWRFMEKETYPLSRLFRLALIPGVGDVLVICTPAENDPAAIAVPHPNWRYRSEYVSQYWRIPAKDVRPDLRVRVNGRRHYWIPNSPIPGGPVFENFQLCQTYVPGQLFIFGLSRMGGN
jgi:hypothetical protein